MVVENAEFAQSYMDQARMRRRYSASLTPAWPATGTIPSLRWTAEGYRVGREAAGRRHAYFSSSFPRRREAIVTPTAPMANKKAMCPARLQSKVPRVSERMISTLW